MRQLLVVLCFALALFAGAARASRLGGFEQDVTSPSSGSGSSVPSDESSGEDCNPLFMDCSSDEDTLAPAKKVELLPRNDRYTQLGLRYHDAFQGVNSYDLRFEKVSGKYGWSAKYDYYTEQNTTTTLGVAGIYLLYRPPASKQLQVDVGVGLGSLIGTQVNTGLSLELPLRAIFSEHTSFLITPAITFLTNQMQELSSALEIRGGNWIYSIGYKSLRGPTQRLAGPYLGFAYRW